MRSTLLVALALVMGCDGVRLDQLSPQHAARTRIVPEPPGEHCPHGGQAVHSGLDLDDDGVLGDTEVTSTEYACTTVLVSSQPEPAGTHCEHGGQAVRTGPDLDADGQLDAAEVMATEYVCATAVADVLVRTRQVPPGEKCPRGGQVSHAGRDVDGDGLLDDPEITREVYGCTEPAPVLTRVLVVPWEAFDCEPSGSRIEAGLDVDEDGVFDDAEVRASLILCVESEQVRVRQQPEPAGARCPAGGIAVQAGRDMNGDGQLSHNEALATTYVCQPTATFEGTYEVRDAADLVALQSISHIRGGLDIAGTGLTAVEVPGLVSVEGSLSIRQNPSLTSLKLQGLRSVGENVIIAHNERLAVLVLGAAGPLPEHELRINELSVDTNARLQTLFGLSSVVPRRSITLRDNAQLTGGQLLPYVRELSDYLNVSENPSMESLPFGNLETVGGHVSLYGNGALGSLAGLEKLRRIGGGLYILDNDTLTSLVALSGVEHIGSDLFVGSNDSLRALELASLTHAGHIRVESNLALETVGPMPVLESVDGLFSLTLHPTLVGVTGFPRLVSVGEGLNVADNALLTDLSAFSRLLRLKYLWAQRNGALTSLKHLRALREVGGLFVEENTELARLELDGLAQVSLNFRVTDNPKLPGCLATSLAAGVYTGPAGERVIERNAGTACVP